MKMVIVHTISRDLADPNVENDYPTVPIDISDQEKRDILELMFTDFFKTNNLIHVEIEFVKPKRAMRQSLLTISDARHFLRHWQAL
jgi:hypothetical protein